MDLPDRIILATIIDIVSTGIRHYFHSMGQEGANVQRYDDAIVLYY